MVLLLCVISSIVFLIYILCMYHVKFIIFPIYVHLHFIRYVIAVLYIK